jgi:hypothetical protein
MHALVRMRRQKMPSRRSHVCAMKNVETTADRDATVSTPLTSRFYERVDIEEYVERDGNYLMHDVIVYHPTSSDLVRKSASTPISMSPTTET